MNNLHVYTDGSCSPNPGVGGWASVFVLGDKVIKKMSGYSPETTNNRMELTAVFESLKEIPNVAEDYGMILLYTDSKYIVNAFEEGWIEGWKRKNFRKVKNTDLWIPIIEMAESLPIVFKWVKGHESTYWNIQVDELANRVRNKR